MSRRAHSPLPPPREPRGPMYDPGRERGGPPPGPPRRRGREESPPPMWRGRGSPPPYGPPKRSRRGDDDYYDRYDRSPPHHRRGGGGYDDRDDYYHGGRGGPPYEPYGQPPPPPREKQGPLSFAKFVAKHSNEEMGPEEAQRAYDAYLLETLGDQVEAEWHKTKKSAAVRERFHPAAFEERLARRRAAASEAAAAFVSDLEAGKLDPESEGFNQGNLDLEPFAAAPDAPAPDAAGAGPRPPPPPPASALLWAPARAAADVKAAMRLAAVLDDEKGVERNPLLPEAPAPMEDEDKPDPEAPSARPSDAGASDGGAAPAAAPAAVAGGGALLAALLAAIDDGAPAAPDAGDGEALDRLLGKLDLVLTWLWRVHGVDYYAGRELSKEDDWARHLTTGRSLRGPRPEEGEELDDTRAKKDSERLALTVDDRWAARIRDGDPILRGCMRDEIQRRLDDWVESQIFKQNDNKWGNHISTKFFLEKKFVVKHILNKQQEAVEKARAAISEDIARERFRDIRGAELRREQQDRAAARAAAGPPGGGGGAGGYGGDYGGPPGGDDWGGGGGEGWGRRGPGGPGGFSGRVGPGGIPIVDPAMMMAGGMGAPVIIPLGGGMMAPMMGGVGVPPGIVPLGGGVLPGGIVPLGGMAPGGDFGGRGGGRSGGRGGRGRGGGGGGPRGAYFDLDAPSNNRDVLDYSDLL